MTHDRDPMTDVLPGGEVVNLRPDNDGAGLMASSGGSGPTDGLDARVASLEAHVSHAVSDLDKIARDQSGMSDKMGDIRVDIATIQTKLDQKPSKGFIVTVVLAAFVFLAGISLFHERLVHLFG